MKEAGKKENVNKIIYFDSETIKNSLQELDKGESINKSLDSRKTEVDANIEIGGKIKIGVPFVERLGFLFSGKISGRYIKNKENLTTITSTELSEFERIKKHLTEFKNMQIRDIENSSTFFRVAGGYLKIVQGGIDGVDVQEFKKVIDSFDGYDTYQIDSNTYVRFNNTSFVSNYKGNDLLLTNMNGYGVFIEKFKKDQFDYIEQIGKMEELITDTNAALTLADSYPGVGDNSDFKESDNTNKEQDILLISLYDIVYACVPFGGKDE